ncbi:MAG: chorismate pyruvate-lyase family protein [Nitrososphaerales archaeon]
MKVSIEGDFGREMLLQLQQLERQSNIKLRKSHKILLAEIGTVEQVLSILLNMPVIVEVKKQALKDYKIEREVVLRANNKELMHATTEIDVRALPSAVVADIKEGKLGIGTILSKHKLETFRRIVEIGYDSTSNIVYRVYEILYGAEPKFRIREEFSIDKIE